MVAIASFAVAESVKSVLPSSLPFAIIVCGVSAMAVALLAYSLGLTKGERAFINDKIVNIYNKITRNDNNNR